MALGLCLLLGTAVFAVAGAAAGDGEPVAKPPPFDGAMSFPAIGGPAGPEQFSWTVELSGDQELIQVDSRHLRVVDTESGHAMMAIEATPAHDAEGATVPTTIALVEADVFTLTVHHRAGNPAAAGAPFDYPITSGAGWEGGFHTRHATLPPGEGQEPAPKCVTPRLTGNSLARARERLAKRGCTLGAVRGKRGKGTRVVKQFRAPGTVLKAGARVAVKLG